MCLFYTDSVSVWRMLSGRDFGPLFKGCCLSKLMWQEKEPWKYTDLTLLQPLGVWHMTSFNPLNWKSEVMDADHTDQPS